MRTIEERERERKNLKWETKAFIECALQAGLTRNGQMWTDILSHFGQRDHSLRNTFGIFLQGFLTDFVLERQNKRQKKIIKKTTYNVIQANFKIRHKHVLVYMISITQNKQIMHVSSFGGHHFLWTCVSIHDIDQNIPGVCLQLEQLMNIVRIPWNSTLCANTSKLMHMITLPLQGQPLFRYIHKHTQLFFN